MTTPAAFPTPHSQPISKVSRGRRNKNKASDAQKGADQDLKTPGPVKSGITPHSPTGSDLAQFEDSPQEQQAPVQRTSSTGSASFGQTAHQHRQRSTNLFKLAVTALPSQSPADTAMPSRLPASRPTGQQQATAVQHAKAAPQQTKPGADSGIKADQLPVKTVPLSRTSSQGSSGSGPHANGSTAPAPRRSNLQPVRYAGSGSSNGSEMRSNTGTNSTTGGTGWEGKQSWELQQEARAAAREAQEERQQPAAPRKKSYVAAVHPITAPPAAAAPATAKPASKQAAPAAAESLPKPASDGAAAVKGSAAVMSTLADQRSSSSAVSAAPGSSGGLVSQQQGTVASQGDKPGGGAPGAYSRGREAHLGIGEPARTVWAPKAQSQQYINRASSNGGSSSDSGDHQATISSAPAATAANGSTATVTSVAAKSAAESGPNRAPAAAPAAVTVAGTPAAMPPTPSSSLAAKASATAVQQQQQHAAPAVHLPSSNEVNNAVNSSRGPTGGSSMGSTTSPSDGAVGHAPVVSADSAPGYGDSSVAATHSYVQQQQHVLGSSAEPAAAPAISAAATETPGAARHQGGSSAGPASSGQQQLQHQRSSYTVSQTPAGSSGGGSASVAVTRRLSADAPPYVAPRSMPMQHSADSRHSSGSLGGSASSQPATSDSNRAVAVMSSSLETQWLQDAARAAPGGAAGRPGTADGAVLHSSSGGGGSTAAVRASTRLLQELSEAMQKEQQAFEQQQAEVACQLRDAQQQQQREASARGAAEGKVAELERSLDAARKTIKELESRCASQASQVETLQSDVHTAVAGRHSAAEQAAAAASHVSHLQQQLSVAEAEKAQLQQQLHSWQSSYTSIEAQNRKLEAHNRDLLQLLGPNAAPPAGMPAGAGPAAGGGSFDCSSDAGYDGRAARPPPPGFGPVPSAAVEAPPAPGAALQQQQQQQYDAMYLKNEHQLVLIMLSMLSEDPAAAIQWGEAELQAVNVKLVPLNWSAHYYHMYGHISQFMQERPAVFGQRADGALYKQPGAHDLVLSKMREEQEAASSKAAAPAGQELAGAAAVPVPVPGNASWGHLQQAAGDAGAAGATDWVQQHVGAQAPPRTSAGAMPAVPQAHWPPAVPGHVPMSMPMVPPFTSGSVPYHPHPGQHTPNW